MNPGTKRVCWMAYSNGFCFSSIAARVDSDTATRSTSSFTVGWISPGPGCVADKRDAFIATRAMSCATPPGAAMRSAMV